MGILNNKERIFDTIVTQEGRRQIASGKLKAEFFSFTDGASLYDQSRIVSGSSLDETNRICFEATNLPQDQVSFEADDSGKLMALKGSEFKISAGQIYSGSRNENLMTGDQFASSVQNLISSASIDSFAKLRILGSQDFFDRRNNTFDISETVISFSISDNKPFSPDSTKEANIDHVESLFMDKRLSHLPNFQYLPPVNRARIGSVTSSLGTYPSLGQAPIETTEQLEAELKWSTDNGFSKTITFFETSKQNNLVCQFFEASKNSLSKLDVIDFGLFTSPTDLVYPTKHVFFIGKVFIDGNGSSTFVNLFTLVFK